MKEAGVNTVQDVKDLNDGRMNEVSSISGIGKKLLLTIRAKAKATSQGVSPYPIAFDWVEGNDNPYKAQYGDDWREQMKKVSRSIQHIDTHTQNAFKGTPFEDVFE